MKIWPCVHQKGFLCKNDNQTANLLLHLTTTSAKLTESPTLTKKHSSTLVKTDVQQGRFTTSMVSQELNWSPLIHLWHRHLECCSENSLLTSQCKSSFSARPAQTSRGPVEQRAQAIRVSPFPRILTAPAFIDCPAFWSCMTHQSKPRRIHFS